MPPSGHFAPLYAVRQTADKGRALFALTFIAKGSVITEAQAILLPLEDGGKLGETGVWPYRFALDEHCALIFGDITFCNHSDTPNSFVSWTRLTPGTAVARLIASTDIGADTELVIRYADLDEYHRRGIVFA
jgi:hypothetical protein